MTTPFEPPTPIHTHGAPRVAVLGAGPVGLEVALAARERGHPVKIYEASPSPAGNVRSWGHVSLFTPWRMNVSERMRLGLREIGAPLDENPEACPTGHAYADAVLDPLFGLFPQGTSLCTGTRVVEVGREGMLKHEEIGTGARRSRPFRLLLVDGRGIERVEHAEIVFDCTGKYGNANRLGDGGIPAPGERRLGARIERRIPDLRREAPSWAGQAVLLVGAGHSAQTAARDLAELAAVHPGTNVLWSIRSESPDWGAVKQDPLSSRAELTNAAQLLAGGASSAIEVLPGTVVDALAEDGREVRVRLRRRADDPDGDGRGAMQTVRVDRILALTGGVGDHAMYRQLQVHECYATCGPMKLAAALLGSSSADCLDQETHGADTLVNPEPDFYILGDKSYGRNNTFLLRAGWSQVDEVFSGPAARRLADAGVDG